MMMKLFFLLLVSTTFVSCSDEYLYLLIVSNRSNETIDEVKVWYGKGAISHGVVSSNASSTNAGTKPRLKDKMKITWVDSDNIAHQQVFDTFNFIPEDYRNGNVIFAYQGNDQFVLKFHMPKDDFPKLSELVDD